MHTFMHKSIQTHIGTFLDTFTITCTSFYYINTHKVIGLCVLMHICTHIYMRMTRKWGIHERKTTKAYPDLKGTMLMRLTKMMTTMRLVACLSFPSDTLKWVDELVAVLMQVMCHARHIIIFIYNLASWTRC